MIQSLKLASCCSKCTVLSFGAGTSNNGLLFRMPSDQNIMPSCGRIEEVTNQAPTTSNVAKLRVVMVQTITRF